jgi:hypothetical protein
MANAGPGRDALELRDMPRGGLAIPSDRPDDAPAIPCRADPLLDLFHLEARLISCPKVRCSAPPEAK